MLLLLIYALICVLAIFMYINIKNSYIHLKKEGYKTFLMLYNR